MLEIEHLWVNYLYSVGILDMQKNNLLKNSCINFFPSYNVWKHVRYHALISHQPGVIKQFR